MGLIPCPLPELSGVQKTGLQAMLTGSDPRARKPSGLPQGTTRDAAAILAPELRTGPQSQVTLLCG